jgi:hypothetical protein
MVGDAVQLRAMLKKLEHDPEALELVARLVELLASRSRFVDGSCSKTKLKR